MATEDVHPSPMTREEAKRILRRLELDAYSAIVTAFRAQGDVDKSKKSILNELSTHLSISTERHRAEVRRVVNDDRLNAVAECMHGPGTAAEWSIEGRRLVSLMPRLVPQTVFTAKASAAANQAVENNQKLPLKTEIEVLPLPTKPKSLPPKPERHDAKDDKLFSKINMLSDNASGKQDDKLKRKKKTNILYSKPSPIALNKTLTNPFKPSATPSSLKPMIKSSQLKYSSSYSVSKTSTALSSPIKYSPKPIILQRSPAKSHPNLSRPPSIQLQSLSSSNVNTPLTSLGSLGSSKSDSSLHLIQSPMIKVVNSSLQNNLNSASSTMSTLHNGSITQKIKFKTPLPKPKVKATKFKPMVPLQRSGLLSSVPSTDGIVLGSSSTVTVASDSPSKLSTAQGVSVKVVQVAKSGISATIPSSLSTNNPVVVVSSNKNLSQRVLAFSTVASTVNQQIKMSTSSLGAASITSTLSKGTLTSKSMPLATGFKMIAVTTVVPGTTQVKTVYIATPIMSLTKTVSQTTGTSITAPATQTVKHVPSSLASNIQSVVARSINAAVLNQTGKALNLHSLPSTTITTAVATPSVAVGKTSKLLPNAKGLGSFKTTLSGASQSLKLFTAVTRSRQLNVVNTMKNAPLLPSTSLLSSDVSQQQNLHRVGNIQIKSMDIPSQRKDKQQVVNVTHQVPSSTLPSNYLNIGSATVNTFNTDGGEQIVADDSPLQTTLTLNVNNFDEDVSSTLNLLNDNAIATEQITASATAETDDMAFLNAGEKFLEQLSAKMTATSPESLTKTESFIFPANLSIGLANEALNQNQSIFEFSKDVDISTLGGTTVQLKQPDLVSRNTNYLINQKTPGSHNIGLVTSKMSTHILNNNISLVNARFNLAANNLNNVALSQGKTGSHMFSSRSVAGNLSVSKPTFQQKSVNNQTILNYPNITKVGGKTEMLNAQSENIVNTVGFINVGNTLSIDNAPSSIALKLTPSQSASKLQMSLPGSSKLNISPVLVNNVGTNNSMTNNQGNNDFFTQICTAKSPVNSLIPFSTINNLHADIAAADSTNASVGVRSINHTLNAPEMNSNSENCNGKKRKLSEAIIPPSRTQASWIRGAANLLARVSRFRGSNKQKGEMNAASWFTKPVDQNDAPGYYRIIKNPMDFGKIKRKLEDGEYESYPTFYEDMMLIKKNCYIYNPEGHITRKDCDDVFAFFEVEYRKLLQRWEKHHVSPQKKMKIALEDAVTAS